MLDSTTIELIKSLSKDDAAFEKLKQMIEKERDTATTLKNHLDLLESAVRNDYDSILITDLNLDKPGPRIVYVNDGFEKMTGYSRDEVIGESPRILQGEKTDRKVLDRLKECLIKGKSFFGQTVNYRKDGSEYINQWDIHPLLNKKGEITHWVSYQHDITERKRAEKKLVSPNVEFDDLFEETKKTFIDFNPDGSVIEANKAFREMLGYQKDEIKGKMLWDFTPEKSTPALKAVFGASLLDDLPKYKDFNVMFRRKNGLPVQAEISMTRMLEDGNVFIRGEISNVSLRKNVIDILQKRNDTFNKLFERKNDFNYGFKISGSSSPEITWISDGFKNLTGYSTEECTGPDGFNKLIHDDDLHLVTEHYNAVKKGKSSCQQFRIKTKSGEIKHVMDYSKPDSEVTDEFKSSVVAVDKQNSLKTV
jgi:PAS domain S-box-containing protein